MTARPKRDRSWACVHPQWAESGARDLASGGENWLDGLLVRKDGVFVLPELEGLNPERLRWSPVWGILACLG